ncbi:MAG: Yip1 family protein [Ignavibacteriaceae bacterium]
MNLVERAKNILVTPKTEWEVIKNEALSNNDILMKYVLILAAIPAICTFIGYSVFGIPVFITTVKVPVGQGIAYMILYYILTIAGVYIVAAIMDALAPSFGSAKNFNASLKVVAFSYTASWVAGIFHIFPALSILSILGLYSLYLLWLGMKTVKEVPQDKMVGYYVVLIIAVIIVYFIIGTVVSAITLGSLYSELK